MSLSVEEVLKIAHLARLELTEEEALKYSSELTKILDYFNKLQNLNTEKIPPTFHALKIPTPFREDKVKPFKEIEKILKNAPQTYQKMIVVPKVVKSP